MQGRGEGTAATPSHKQPSMASRRNIPLPCGMPCRRRASMVVASSDNPDRGSYCKGQSTPSSKLPRAWSWHRLKPFKQGRWQKPPRCESASLHPKEGGYKAWHLLKCLMCARVLSPRINVFLDLLFMGILLRCCCTRCHGDVSQVLHVPIQLPHRLTMISGKLTMLARTLLHGTQQGSHNR